MGRARLGLSIADVAGKGIPVLGVFPDGAYDQGQVAISTGDRVILFTDGITEARNAADEEFGEDQLIELARHNRACSAPALQARLAKAVATFTGGLFQDDATLIVNGGGVAAPSRSTFRVQRATFLGPTG
ncbi:MAG: serine/threonine-protein phosphatase [Acidobacteria bacterium]|nr:serine/threonine-protein phosphatase [Acidobacteriota bacterium]